MAQITLEDVPALSKAASLLGAGGGGDPELIVPMLRRVLREHGPVEVVDPAQLPPGSLTVPVGGAGSVTVMHEKPMEGTEFVRAFRAVEGYVGVKAHAVSAVCMAGIMAMFPVVAAAQLGLPLVDADGASRGTTKLSQTTLTLAGIDLTPAAFADDKGASLLVDGVKSADAELIVRLSIPAMGGWSIQAWRPLSVDEVARGLMVGSYSMALEMGRLLEAGDREGLAACYGARTLFHGKIIEVPRRHFGQSSAGSVVVEHAEQPDRALRIEMQNEFLVALEDGHVVACVPDLICVLEQETGTCLLAEQVRYGLWVEVLGIPCQRPWRSAAGLDLLGPRAFGYDLDYVPLDEAVR
ncbi:DUF917 domain-containing protein [Streptomyces sp. NPDC048506]|uniref:DUF917 domain-containing protein n=1 Tax=Streptomyces sp. NPDC048506 TaxID=3155028 RepID=UPI0034161377